jgi:hypothetical protein
MSGSARKAGALGAALLALLAAPAAFAQAGAAPLCDSETGARLRFLEERLAGGQTYARWWWGGWLGFYATGTVVQSVRAGLEDEGDGRADYTISAVKALIGTTRLLVARPQARLGAEPLLALPLDEPAHCAARLGVGEETLLQNAKEADARWDWRRHAFNVGLNVVGGVIADEAFDAQRRGWISAGVGIAVGTAMILSHPWQAAGDLAEYERRFPASGVPADPPTSWRIVPWPGGAALALRF